MRSVLLLAALTMSGCFQPPSFLTDTGTAELLQGSNEVLIATTQIEAEVVQAQVSASSLVTQTIPAAASGALAGASVSFSPGTLALDATITVQEGASFVDDEVTSALGLSTGAVNVVSAPLVVASSAAQDPVKPFTLALPLTATGLWLAEGELAVMYIVNDYANGVQKTGVIPPSDVTLKDGVALFSGRYFGSYSLVRVKVEIKAPLVVATAKQVVTKSEQAKDTTPPGAFSITAPSSVTSSPAKITWTRATDAVTYGIRVGTDAKCETFKLATRVGDVTTFEVNLDDGKYFVCVKAFDAVENAVDASNSGWAFEVMAAAGGTATPSTPSLPGPMIQTSMPRAPADVLAFNLMGSAPSGSMVEVFDNGACSGTPLTSATDAIFQTSGIPVSVSGPGMHPFTARTVTSAGPSGCSNVFVFSHPQMVPETNVGPTNSVESAIGIEGAMLPDGRLITGLAIGGSSTNTEPHVVDFASNSVMLLRDINPGMGSSPRFFTQYNGYVYFAADDGASGAELWRTDGSVVGTTKAIEIYAGSMGSMPSQLKVVGGYLVFVADDGIVGHEVMSFDGTTLTTHDIYGGSSGSGVTSMGVFNNELYVAGSDGISGSELWRITPGVPGATLVKDIHATPGYPSMPESFTEMGGYLYFTADDGINGKELWRTDGTEAGTTLAHDFTGDSQSSYPNRLARVGSKLFMTAEVSAVIKLYTFDGTTASFVTSLQNPENSVAATDQYYFFSQDDAAYGKELWRSDGTPAGTMMVADVVGGAMGTYGMQIKRIGQHVVFDVDQGGYRYPHMSDGTMAGTWRVLNRRLSYIHPLQVFGNVLLIAGEDSPTGIELYHATVNP